MDIVGSKKTDDISIIYYLSFNYIPPLKITPIVLKQKIHYKEEGRILDEIYGMNQNEMCSICRCNDVNTMIMPCRYSLYISLDMYVYAATAH